MATDPGTRSPGHLFLRYSAGVSLHTTSLRFVDGVDLNDIATIRGDVNPWSDDVAACLPNTHSVNEWGIRSNEGTVLYAEAFAVPKVGTKGTGMPNYNSSTVYIEGHGNSIAAGSLFGHMGFRLFCGGCIIFTPGLKRLVIASDPNFQRLADNLNLSTRIFADFYGQKGDVAAYAPVQFNAHAQRVLGC